MLRRRSSRCCVGWIAWTVGSNQVTARINVVALWNERAGETEPHLRHDLARRPQNVIRSRLETVGREVATEARNGAFGHPCALGIVDILDHLPTKIHHGTDTPLSVVDILIERYKIF